MDDRIRYSQVAEGASGGDYARRLGASGGSSDAGSTTGGHEDAAYICDIQSTAAPLPEISSLGAVIRRASLIATAVHACELASGESRIRRQSWIGHGSEARA